MSSVTENLARVRSDLADNAHEDKTHAHILDAYEEAFKEHEAQLRGQKEGMERHRRKRRRREDRSGHEGHTDKDRDRGLKFRFKSKSSGSDHKRSRKGEGHRRPHRTSRGTSSARSEAEQDGAHEKVDRYSAHPLPRPSEETWLDPSLPPSGEPTTSHPNNPRAEKHDRPSTPPHSPPPPDPDTAFATSLFDALADDEGAFYWEAVYSQPLHIYPRPGSGKDPLNPSHGSDADPLQQMTDEEYVLYVKRKMWEKANPHLVREMEMREEREREREGRERGRRDGGRGTGRGRGPGGREDVDAALARGEERRARKAKEGRESGRWEGVWEGYVRAWKEEGLGRGGAGDIPWPVEGGRIEDVDAEKVRRFFEGVVRYVLPRAEGEEVEGKVKVAMLKGERFRWHPDKVLHRFGGGEGGVDEGVMERVTGCFQVVDAMLEEERRRTS
ncbi:hypothetical protein BDZ85DRAFT_293086 [Elsinoe ampelina]|uniref:Uncharacterized protein n=1 Tax=Elsinoe ampelina TaxID=302913 RepID=A0A6A6GQV7_9PEZI|nr:hypothetical protein BDZ85DRAFT_293086 [Elsinoe ampelina]